MLVNYLFTIEAGVFRKLIQKLKAAKQWIIWFQYWNIYLPNGPAFVNNNNNNNNNILFDEGKFS
jgi:primase-polymerase (primpol)-like protein